MNSEDAEHKLAVHDVPPVHDAAVRADRGGHEGGAEVSKPATIPAILDLVTKHAARDPLPPPPPP